MLAPTGAVLASDHPFLPALLGPDQLRTLLHARPELRDDRDGDPSGTSPSTTRQSVIVASKRIGVNGPHWLAGTPPHPPRSGSDP